MPIMLCSVQQQSKVESLRYNVMLIIACIVNINMDISVTGFF